VKPSGPPFPQRGEEVKISPQEKDWECLSFSALHDEENRPCVKKVQSACTLKHHKKAKESSSKNGCRQNKLSQKKEENTSNQHREKEPILSVIRAAGWEGKNHPGSFGNTVSMGKERINVKGPCPERGASSTDLGGQGGGPFPGQKRPSNRRCRRSQKKKFASSPDLKKSPLTTAGKREKGVSFFPQLKTPLNLHFLRPETWREGGENRARSYVFSKDTGPMQRGGAIEMEKEGERRSPPRGDARYMDAV